jgi:undecaprenyl-diphosphatase
MSILQAILLGLIQGLTEFIPISSTAHLVLVGKLLNLGQRLTAEQITAFNAVIQLGTLVAVIAYFFRDIYDIAFGFVADHLSLARGKGVIGESARLGWLVIIGTIPIVVIGFAFKKQIEGVFTKDLRVIAGAMIGLAILLTVAEFVGSRRFEMKAVTWRDALLIGLAQSCALIPGSSRSGTTITAGLFLGLTRETAARFSFIMSIPAIGAAGVLEFARAYKNLDASLLAAMLAGAIVAGVSGYASIAFLMYYLKSHSTFIFVGYRLLLGGAILGLLAFKVVTPN